MSIPAVELDYGGPLTNSNHFALICALRSKGVGPTIQSRQHLKLLQKQVHNKGGIVISIGAGLEHPFCARGGIFHMQFQRALKYTQSITHERIFRS